MINGFIKGQALTLSSPVIASGTIDYLTARFTFFTNEWEHLDQIWVHFRQGDKVFDAQVVDGRVKEDEHINLTEGEWNVYLHGNTFENDEVKQRITTEPQTVKVVATGSLEGEPFPNVDETTAEKLLAVAKNAEEKADKAIKAVADVQIQKGVQSLTAFPEVAKEGDVVLLHRCNEITADDSNSGIILDLPAILSLGVPEGYQERTWEITATDPKGYDFYAIIEISRIDDYILTALFIAAETVGGRWYWKNGEFTTDITGGETELPPVNIPLGNVDDFIFTRKLFDIDYEEFNDTDETVIFRTLPLHYMFLNGEWQLVSPNNGALRRAVEELQRNVSKYVPMSRVETTTTGTSIVEPNKMYNYGVVDTLTVVFDEGTPNKVNEYLFSFISGETATVLTLPENIVWANGKAFEAVPNAQYTVTVLNGVASFETTADVDETEELWVAIKELQTELTGATATADEILETIGGEE